MRSGELGPAELLDLRPRPTPGLLQRKVAVGVLEMAAARGLRVPGTCP